MKISNETKVGALTAIAIVLLILGFNFLKGKTFFKTGNFLNAEFADAKGLMVSNPVFINGFQVGSVYEIENTDPNLKNIAVALKLKDSYNIPTNSTATIKSNPLGTPTIEITLGDSKTMLKSGEKIATVVSAGLLAGLSDKVGPIADEVKNSLKSLDAVLKNLNTVLDPNTKNNLQSTVANINKVTEGLVGSSASLQQLLNTQSGSLAKSLNNVDTFTRNLNKQNEKIGKMMSNIETTTENLAKTDIDGAINKLKSAIGKLDEMMTKLQSNEGSLGMLMNDKQLYNQLVNTIRSANILVDDLRTHPKRYVNISVFGKKDKGGALTAPLPIDTTSQKN
jgi:phospholipid/cholesterol/gamma-HCH transport system substrate-binding protein